MRRWLGWLAIGWLLIMCGVALLAYGSPATHVSLTNRSRALAAELRCPACQGESVADSQATIAVAIRGIIRERLGSGQSPDQIKAYLVSRFGDRILLAPSTTGIDSIAWIAPPLLVVAGIGLLLTLVTDWRKRGKAVTLPAREEYVNRVRAEVAAESVD